MAVDEAAVSRLAGELAAAAVAHPVAPLSARWWQQALLDWAAEHESFRVQLLRFVDVLPTLRDPDAIAEHVLEYFSDDAPPFLRRAARLTATPGLRLLLSRLVERAVFAMADRFIVGDRPETALPKLERLLRHGQAFSIDLLGEATLSVREADAYLDRYLGLVELLGRRQELAAAADARWQGAPVANLSIKVSALTHQMEAAAPDAVVAALRPRLERLLRTARQWGAFVHVDMEQHRYKDLVQRAFAALALDPAFRDWDGLGVVVQAYLREAADDLAWAEALAQARGAPITVRLVKGAYWDEELVVAGQHSWEPPVFTEKAATDAMYEQLTSRLLRAWPQLRPAFGSHNPRSLAQAALKAEERGLSLRDFEFQMLYGLAPELAAAASQRGYRVRIYAPVGAIIPGMAYLVRRLLENTSNEAWFRNPYWRAMGQAARVPQAPTAEPARAEPPRRPAGFRNAAPARWFEPPVREAMAAALAACRAQAGGDVPLLLAGRAVMRPAVTEVRYPADPAVLLGRVADATPEDVETAVQAATRAFPAWRDLGVGQRAALLRRAADALEARRYEFAALMVFESGKPWREADGDVTEAVDYLRYYAQQAEELERPQPLLEPPGEQNEYLREPRGVAVVIAPWNFPLAILTGMTVAALATGNTAIVKPSGYSPLVAYRLVQLLHQAGVPAEAVQFLPGPGATVGQALVEHPGVSTIAFTGSNPVGLGILAAAARVVPGQRWLKTVVAELGGKNAVIVDADADLDLAVADTVTSAFGYAGQKCSACSRLIAVGSAYEEALARLGDAVRSLCVGPPHLPETVVPPVISAAARDRINEYAALGRATARLVAEAPAPEGPGHYVAPQVFDGVDPGSPLAQDEIFGPVLCVFRARTFDEALALANDTRFGLTGGLFSRQPSHIERARREFRVGNLYINRKVTGAVVGRQAFGGLNLSGEGEKAGGPDYLRQFTVSRTVTENTLRRGFAPRAPASG